MAEVAWQRHEIGAQRNPMYLCAQDMDGDGDLDIVLAGMGIHTIHLVRKLIALTGGFAVLLKKKRPLHAMREAYEEFINHDGQRGLGAYGHLARPGQLRRPAGAAGVAPCGRAP
jgi:hypothetical protein